jgi:F-type H+-transporting ATPase subunit b
MNTLRRAVIAASFAAAALPALASSEGGGGGGGALIQPQIGTVFWTLITFLLLLALLGRFAWKPLLGALQHREKSIQESIDKARADREEAEELLRQHHALLDQARRERAEAVSEGQRDAEKLKAEILDEARKQREQLLAQTQSQVDAGLRQARGELRAVAVDLAIQAAEKLLTSNLDDATQRKLVEDYLADLEKSGDSSSLPS